MEHDLLDIIQEMTKNNPPIDEYLLQFILDQQTDLMKLRKQYEEAFFKLQQKSNENATRKEYSSGGQALHRGLYCPSLILDKIVGGYNRGKRMKQPTSKSKQYYEYFFDQNVLTMINKIVDGKIYQIEFLIYDQQTEYGITFHEPYLINLISKVVYTDGLPQYYLSMPVYDMDSFGSIFYEEYHYENKILSSVTTYFDIIPQYNMINKQESKLVYDGNGNLIGYYSNNHYYDILA